MLGCFVNSVEQAIRAALNKGDASDRAFRRQIYGSASSALERSLAARPFNDEDIAARRKSLLATIRHIESEFLVAVEAELPSSIEVATFSDNRTAALPENSVGQGVKAQAVEAFAQTTPMAGIAVPQVRELKTKKPLTTKEQRKQKNWLSYAFNGLFFIIVAVGGYWIYLQGQQVYFEATTPNLSGQKPVLAEPTVENVSDTNNWIEVFSARDTDLLSLESGSDVEILSRGGISYVKMMGNGTTEVAIKIGAGLVQTFAGKRVLFNIKARSLSNAPVDIGARCDFGAETKCDRKRFKIGSEFTEYMFAVDVSASARGDGSLQIAPDLAAAGGAIEVETIHATIIDLDAG